MTATLLREKSNPRELLLNYTGSNSKIRIHGFTEHLLQDTWNGLLSYCKRRHDSLPSARRNIGLHPFLVKAKVMQHHVCGCSAEAKHMPKKWKRGILMVKTSRLFRKKKGMTHFSVIYVLLNALYSLSKGTGDKINPFLSSNSIWAWSFISETVFFWLFPAFKILVSSFPASTLLRLSSRCPDVIRARGGAWARTAQRCCWIIDPSITLHAYNNH